MSAIPRNLDEIIFTSRRIVGEVISFTFLRGSFKKTEKQGERQKKTRKVVKLDALRQINVNTADFICGDPTGN